MHYTINLTNANSSVKPIPFVHSYFLLKKFLHLFRFSAFQSTGIIGLEQLIIPILELEGSFILVFITCEIFGKISNDFDTISDIMDQFKWYLFPVEVQRILPTILMHAQQPVNINCFGSIPCNRETFKQV